MSGKLTLTLLPSVGEPPIEDASHQDAQRELFRALAEKNITVQPQVIVRKSAGSEGGWQFFGTYLIDITKNFGPIIGVIIGAWIQGRAGRKVKLKFDDIEVEAKTPEEINTLLQKVISFRSEKINVSIEEKGKEKE